MYETLFYITMLMISLKYPASIIMYLCVLLINTLVKVYLNKTDFYLLIINLIIVYKIFKKCLLKYLKSNKKNEELTGIKSFFNPFNGRTCNDGILCSFMAFAFYFLIYAIVNIYNYLNMYGFDSTQGFMVYTTVGVILFIFLVVYNGYQLM